MPFQKNSKTRGRWERGREQRSPKDMQIPGVGILKKWKSMRKFQGSIKKEVEFLGVINWSRKNHVEFPWVLVFGLDIFKPKKECITILQNFLGWSLFFSGISKRKSDKPKYSKVFFTKMLFSPRQLPLFGFFSGIQ